jgi:DNA modification methylase
MKNKIIKTELVNWKEIVPFQPDSIKKQTPEQKEKLKRSLLKNGFVSPLSVWQKGKKIYAIDCHMRLRALNELEAEGHKIPEKMTASFLKIKDEKEAKKYVLVFNSHYGKMKGDILGDWVSDLNIDDLNLEIDIPEINLDNILQKEIVEDEAPPIPEKPRSKLGDLYEIGQHRVLCGDSQTDIDKALRGEKIDMVFTDPPYGVSIGDKHKLINKKTGSRSIEKDIKNDNIGLSELKEILVNVFKNIKLYSSNECTYYSTSLQGGDLMMMMMMMKESGLQVRHVIIWVKNSPTFSLGRLDYDYKHEPILYTWNKSHKFYGNGEQKSSVWNYDKPLKNDLHPTMKPVKLIVNAILNSSLKDMIIFDPFLGSGSTLIACEQTNRKCYGIEIDPHYIDVIIQRWVNFTGIEKIKKNGKEIIWSK